MNMNCNLEKEIERSVYCIVSAGFQGADVFTILKASVNMSINSALTVTESSNAIIAVLNFNNLHISLSDDTAINEVDCIETGMLGVITNMIDLEDNISEGGLEISTLINSSTISAEELRRTVLKVINSSNTKRKIEHWVHVYVRFGYNSLKK